MRTGRILAPSCFMVCPLQVPARSLPRRAPGAGARGPCHSHQIVSARCCRSNMLTLPQMQTAPFPPTENMPAGAFCCIVGVCYSHTLPQLQTDMSAPSEHVPQGTCERAYPSASVPSLSLFPLPTFSASTDFFVLFSDLPLTCSLPALCWCHRNLRGCGLTGSLPQSFAYLLNLFIL